MYHAWLGCMTMGNGGFNPFFEHEHLSNDHQQAMATMIGLGIMAIITVLLVTLPWV
jgi:hypothetical protein